MEIVALKNKESITAARSLNQVWLCHYPRPVDCLHYNGTEFVSAKFQELLQSCDPQANLLCSSCLIAQDLNTISAQQ
jgi:hypothetical protein